MGRTLAITKRFSLSQLGDGWEDCHIVYTVASRADYTRFISDDFDNMQDSRAVDYMYDFVKGHCVGGKVLVVEAGKTALLDFESEDVDTLDKETLQELFLGIIGKQDPKASGQEPLAGASQPSDTSTSETSSSMKPGDLTSEPTNHSETSDTVNASA